MAVITPRAPRPTRASSSSSGRSSAEVVRREPSASTISSPRIWVAIPPKRPPVPCVPVDVAPARVCRSMSPRFSMASPCSSRSGVSRCSGMPAPTVTVPDVASTSTNRSRRSNRTWTPSATAMSLNEWPDPTALTRRPSRTADFTVAATSSVSTGTVIRSGVEHARPLQLCQVVGVVTGRDPSGSREVSERSGRPSWGGIDDRPMGHTLSR